MKFYIISFSLLLMIASARAQVSNHFIVQGDINSYYPVIVQDLGWADNVATELTLGRSWVHTDGTWRGAIIAKFRFHTTEWGHGANFIDANIRENTIGPVAIPNFVGGWMDGTGTNNGNQVIIWLRGGGTTYYYTSNYSISPLVYDGAQNPSTYQILNGPSITLKTAADDYVNVNGTTTNANLYIYGTGNNIFWGPLFVGTLPVAGYELAVNGAAIFTKVVVRPYPFADYVFDSSYRLASLGDVEHYIRDHHHLPEVPSADSAEKNGIEIGSNQVVLLKKIEELTLYIIEENKSRQVQDQRLGEQDRILKEQERKIGRLDKSVGHLKK